MNISNNKITLIMPTGAGLKSSLQPLNRHLSELYNENVTAKILQVAVKGLDGNVRSMTPFNASEY